MELKMWSKGWKTAVFNIDASLFYMFFPLEFTYFSIKYPYMCTNFHTSRLKTYGSIEFSMLILWLSPRNHMKNLLKAHESYPGIHVNSSIHADIVLLNMLIQYRFVSILLVFQPEIHLFFNLISSSVELSILFPCRIDVSEIHFLSDFDTLSIGYSHRFNIPFLHRFRHDFRVKFLHEIHVGLLHGSI